MFPHVNLCPLLESHLRVCAETKGLITPDAACLGRGRCAGRGGSLHTVLSGAMASCFFVVAVGASPPLLTKPWMKFPPGARAAIALAEENLAKLWPRRGFWGFSCLLGWGHLLWVGGGAVLPCAAPRPRSPGPFAGMRGQRGVRPEAAAGAGPCAETPSCGIRVSVFRSKNRGCGSDASYHPQISKVVSIFTTPGVPVNNK